MWCAGCGPELMTAYEKVSALRHGVAAAPAAPNGALTPGRCCRLVPFIATLYKLERARCRARNIFVSDKRTHLLVEVARAGAAPFPRARNFDQKVRCFIRYKDIMPGPAIV